MDKLACMTTFVRVVEAGSFAAVADPLGLTAPMVGRQVRALEEHLGVRLLTRTTRRHSLTEAGRIYFDRAKAVLTEIEAADESVTSLRATPRGLLRIDAPVTFGTACLAPALPEYLAANPEMRVSDSPVAKGGAFRDNRLTPPAPCAAGARRTTPPPPAPAPRSPHPPCASIP